MVVMTFAGGFMGGAGQYAWEQFFAMAPVIYNRLHPTTVTQSAPAEPQGRQLPRAGESDGKPGKI